MKDKRWFFVLVVLMVLASLSIFAQTKKLRDIGRYKFIPIEPGTPAPAMMKLIAEKYADDIQRGFDLAGYPDLYPPFIDQVRQAAYTKADLAVGSRIPWMIFRSQGQIRVVHDLEWAGQEPLSVFSFSVQEGGRQYTLIMPESCGNISLLRMGPVQAASPEPVPPQPPYQEGLEDRYQISKAKIYQDFADLINEVDLYCSFSVWEDEIPELRILGAEREYEKGMSSDGDIIYLNKGQGAGIEPSQIFWILDLGRVLPDHGRLAFGTAWARIRQVEEAVSIAVVEHACHGVRRGYHLVPLEAKEGMAGKNLGYDVPPVEAEGTKGRLIYLQGDLQQIGSHQWALIDIGRDQGLQVGQQLILYRRVRNDLPVQILGNSIIVDVKSRTSTIKVLSCRDVIRRGDLVMERPLH